MRSSPKASLKACLQALHTLKPDMRAIKTQQLQAHRDNRNHWKIADEHLDDWRAHSVHAHTSAHPDDSPTIREKLAVQTTRAEAAERAREPRHTMKDKLRAVGTLVVERKDHLSCPRSHPLGRAGNLSWSAAPMIAAPV
jgi:hypothetical protein